MSYTIGGALITSMSLTYAWGGTPSSADIIAKGESTLGAGDEVVLNLDALTFYGKVVADPVDVSDSDGAKIRFSIVDNRERLREDYVACRFNKVVIMEDNPSTPGIDKWKRYEHIHPGDNWEAQIRTYTDTPYTAEEILDFVFDAPTVNNTWLRDYHAAQEKPCHEIDANHGKKLLNVILEVTEAQGLVFTLQGENQLVWARKGEGTAPTPNHIECYNLSEGNSLNNNDTKVVIVGDPNRYQELFIDLEPDWAEGWEDLWNEVDWRAAVNTAFGPFEDDDAGQAELTAKARSVTVREYIVETGTTEGFVDYGKFDGVARLDIPAWIYLTKIVWHAYRVPRTYTINGISSDNLRMVDEMLIAVEGDIDTGEISAKSPDELYPQGCGFVMVKGQQLGIIDPRTQRYITPEQLANARDKWSPCNKFTLDKENKTVFFEDAVFLPGEDEEALFVFPNQDLEDVEETDPLYNICAPNAECTVAPASVRASLTFDAELFSMTFGSGRRTGTEYVSGLNFHSLLDEGANVRQINYQDDVGAEEKAADYAASKITNQTMYSFGGFDRKGVAGTALNGSIDRITATLSERGINERIEFTKERGPSNFTPEGELQRREKERDRYPGERALQQDVRDLRAIAAISRGTGKRSSFYASPSEVMQKPVGGMHSAPRIVDLTGDPRLAGDVIWLDAGGDVDDEGKIFAGVVIANGSQGNGVAVSTQGTVPVRVKGPFAAGDAIGETLGSGSVVQKNGERFIGTVNGDYPGTETVLVPVRLGAGGAVESCPFTPSLSAVEGDPTSLKITFSPGTLRFMPPTNMLDEFTISKTGTYYAKVVGSSDGQSITSAELEVDTDAPEAQVPTPFALPASVDVLLYIFRDGVPFRCIGCGSVGLNSREQFRTDKDPPAEPGELSFTPYYAWEPVLV